MSKKVSCRKDFTRGKGKVKMDIMDTILCGKGVVLECGLTCYCQISGCGGDIFVTEFL